MLADSLNVDVHSCHLWFDHFPFTLIHEPNIPGSYAILFFTALDITSITSHIHSWVMYLLWLHLFILSGITMNKASAGDGIPVELFQILKDDAVKVLHSICQQIWKTQQWSQDWKRSVFISIPKKATSKHDQITAQLHSSHMLAK